MKFSPEEMEELIAEYKLIPTYEAQQAYIREKCEQHNVSLRSLVASLAKRGVYQSKPKAQKKPSTKSVEVQGVGTVSVSKDRILYELEDRLQIPPGDLYSLRSATKEAIIALVLAIKAVEDDILTPEMETFFESFEEKQNG